MKRHSRPQFEGQECRNSGHSPLKQRHPNELNFSMNFAALRSQ
jgi:hypothetical protein